MRSWDEMRWLWVVVAGCTFAPKGQGQQPLADARAVDARTTDAHATDAPPIDAASLCDPLTCVGADRGCVGDTCTIVVPPGGNTLHCPAGMPCRFACEAGASCNNVALDCDQATACTVDCLGAGSCVSGSFNCTSANQVCEWICHGPGTCKFFGETCGGAASCVWDCCNAGACDMSSAGCSNECTLNANTCPP